MKKLLSITCLILTMVIFLTGCSSKKSTAVSLNVVPAAKYISEEKAKSFAVDLKAGLPEYNDGTKSISVTGVSSGDPKADPDSYMAGSVKITSMLASHEIELWICDADNAKRYAEGGRSYVALSTLFTAEELQSFHGTLVKIAVTNSDGKETGEYSELCGIDLSQNTAVKELTGISDPRMFIIAGSPHMDAAKAVFRYIARK
jgi:hypothetical protein